MPTSSEITAASPATLYRRFLAEARALAHPAGRGPGGCWTPDPAVSPVQLAVALLASESDASTVVIKQGPRISVCRAKLFGRDALIKRYDLGGPMDSLKYALRPSRARRAWAAARVLQQVDVPTPAPLGFLEIHRGPVVRRSYVLTEFLADATPAHRWIPVFFSTRPPEDRDLARRQIVDLFLGLYRRGIYHADTKASNFLVLNPDDAARRSFWWTDLECVRFGVWLTRRRIIRNLAQLNGSLRTGLNDNERRAFLRDLAGHYPWLADPRVARRIRRWTLRRLRRERDLPCGS